MRIDASHNWLTELKKQVKGFLENLQIVHVMFSKKSIFHLDIKIVTVVINVI